MKNDSNLDSSGTHLKGYVKATYKELVALLGEPLENKYIDEDRTSTEWMIKFEGSVFTIYDYKKTSLYHKSLPSVKKFRSMPGLKIWHIGGSVCYETFLFSLWDLLDELRNNNKIKEKTK